MSYHVYIMASRPNGAIYVGRTRDLAARVAQRKNGLSAHTSRYRIDRLVWFESHEDFQTSLRRERAIERWLRPWKNTLIAERNPDRDDLWAGLVAV